MLRLLIETCVHRRVAALFATLVVAAFGLRAYLDTPIEAYPGRHQRPGHGHRPAARQRARGDRAPGHRAAGARAERHAGHDADAQREPVRPVADHADFSRRRRPAFTARTIVLQRVAAADLPAGRDARARARGDAARRGLPVPPRERPPRPLPAALRDAMERRARAAPGAGRRRHRALRRLPQGDARRGRRRRACSRTA